MVGYVIFDGPCAFHFLRLRRDGLLNQEWVRVEATLVENCSS